MSRRIDIIECIPCMVGSRSPITPVSNPGIRPRIKMPTKFKLNTGTYIPAMGFGTWQDEKTQEDAVVEAIKAGFRHIDTAVMYAIRLWSFPY